MSRLDLSTQQEQGVKLFPYLASTPHLWLKIQVSPCDLIHSTLDCYMVEEAQRLSAMLFSPETTKLHTQETTARTNWTEDE